MPNYKAAISRIAGDTRDFECDAESFPEAQVKLLEAAASEEWGYRWSDYEIESVTCDGVPLHSDHQDVNSVLGQQFILYLVAYSDRRVAISTVPNSNTYQSISEWGTDEVLDETTVMYAIESALEVAGAKVVVGLSKDLTDLLSEDETEELYGTFEIAEILSKTPELLEGAISGYDLDLVYGSN